MDVYIGLDVSLASTAVCVLDKKGKIGVLHHRRQHRQRPVRRSRARDRQSVEPVAHVLCTDGIDTPVAKGVSDGAKGRLFAEVRWAASH